MLYNKIADKIRPIIYKKQVLDIGSGGNIFYDYKLSTSVTALDISEKSLQNLKDDKIIKISGDARDLSKIKNKSIDVVLIIFALHHINGKNYRSSLTSLRKILEETDKVLKEDGEIIILELTLNKFLYYIQVIFYKLTYLILKSMETDMVFFYNDNIIRNNLLMTNNASKIKTETIKMTGWLDPLLGTFPGIIKIPAFLMPTNLKFFYLKKINP